MIEFFKCFDEIKIQYGLINKLDVFKKEGNGFSLTTYDSEGELIERQKDFPLFSIYNTIVDMLSDDDFNTRIRTEGKLILVTSSIKMEGTPCE